MRGTTTMRVRRVWPALPCALAVLLPGAAAAAPAPASIAQIEVVHSCEADGYVVTSSKDISNIVVRDDEDHRTEYDDGVREVVVPTGDVTTIWVKSGSTMSLDGPGYGERFDVVPGTCGPVDADGDGFTDDVDCDDTDPTTNPGQPDIPNDGIDQNCDGGDLVVGSGDLRATLVWGDDDDLDLHVIDADDERLFWAARETASGGTLDRDDNVGVCGVDPEPGGVENAFWPEGGTPPGTYTIQVWSYSDCAPEGSDWTLQVFIDDLLVEERSGTTSGGGGTGPDDPGALLASVEVTIP
jgi:hypothetical protein